MKISIIICILLVGTFSQVLEITAENFNTVFDSPYSEFAQKSEPLPHQWFMMFYAPWCGHCKRSKPAFTNFEYEIRRNITEMAKQTGLTDAQDIQIQIENSVHVATVNCDEEKSLCQYFGVRGYPTFLYLTKDRKAINYRGPRTVQEFMNFTLNHNPDEVHIAQWHAIDVGIFSTLKNFFTNQIFLFVSLFLLLPFFFGYFFMRKNIQPEPQGEPQIVTYKDKKEMVEDKDEDERAIEESDEEDKKDEKEDKKNV